MARILCIWEMGSNLGHLTNLKLFIDQAIARGHKVSLAARELQNLAIVLDPRSVQLFQAPFIRHPIDPSRTPTISFSQLICRQVFTSYKELISLHLAWQSIFEAVSPDLVIYEHAPSALVASLSRKWQKWAVGAGFMIPRTEGPFLGVFPGVRKSKEHYYRLLESERSLLALLIRLQKENGNESVDSVKEIYRQCDQNFLLTLPELDHFGVRPDGEYFGPVVSSQGLKPVWPGETGPKVFAYLNYFPKLPDLLTLLIEQGARVLLYTRGLPGTLATQFRNKINIVDKPVDLSSAFQQADYVINHGNHSTAAQAYLAGIPQLLIWTHQEQFFFSRRLVIMQRAVLATRNQEEYQSSWEKLITLKRTSAPAKNKESLSLEGQVERINQKFLQAGF